MPGSRLEARKTELIEVASKQQTEDSMICSVLFPSKFDDCSYVHCQSTCTYIYIYIYISLVWSRVWNREMNHSVFFPYKPEHCNSVHCHSTLYICCLIYWWKTGKSTVWYYSSTSLNTVIMSVFLAHVSVVKTTVGTWGDEVYSTISHKSGHAVVSL